jgi:hypothetical protein
MGCCNPCDDFSDPSENEKGQCVPYRRKITCDGPSVTVATAYYNTAQTCSDECPDESGEPISVTIPAGDSRFTSYVSQDDADAQAMAQACAEVDALRAENPCSTTASISRACRSKSGSGEKVGTESFNGDGRKFRTKTVTGSMDVVSIYENQICDVDSCTSEAGLSFSHAVHPDGGSPTFSGSWSFFELSRTLTDVTYQCAFAIERDDTHNMSGVFAYWLSVDGAHCGNGSVVVKNINGFTFPVIVSVTWAGAQYLPGTGACIQPGRFPETNDVWNTQKEWNFDTSSWDTVAFSGVRTTPYGSFYSPIPGTTIDTEPPTFYAHKVSGFGIQLEPDYTSVVTASTSRTTSGVGCAPFPPPGGGGGIVLSMRAIGSVVEALSDEDRAGMVVDREIELIPSWTDEDCDGLTAYTFETEDFVVEFRAVQVQVTAGETIPLISGHDYRITVRFSKRPHGTLDDFVLTSETEVRNFTASSTTEVLDWIDVPLITGFDTKVFGVEIEDLDA